MVGAVGVQRKSCIGVTMEANCGSMLRELELIWTDIGETEAEKSAMLLELEKECMQVYKKKVDEASNARARLRHIVAVKQAELASLRASLGESTADAPHQTRKGTALKEKEALVTPQLEELRLEKQEREKLFMEIKSQIDKINLEISGQVDNKQVEEEEQQQQHDLSMRRINKYQTQLRNLQKEKSDRVRRVLDCVNEVHGLCGVLGMEFGKTLDKVQPGLHEAGTVKRPNPQSTTSISTTTLDGLSQTIRKLKTEKKGRAQKLRDSLGDLYELWNLMDTCDDEKRHFWKLASVGKSSDDDDIKDAGVLSPETFQQVESEVERLSKLKVSRMKQVVLSRRMELEKICRWAHIEPDSSTSPEKLCAMIDSGIVDPSKLMDNIEVHIAKANEEARSRKDIMGRVAKWVTACDEEKWLEDYNQDDKRYSAGRGAHLNLKRAEKARITVTKIPAMVGDLMKKTFGWEDERGKPLMYDGVRLVSILEEYKLCRRQKEEEEKRYRVIKKKLAEKEAIFGSKRRGNGGNNGVRMSTGGVTTELLTPRSYSSGRQNGHFKEMRRLSTTQQKYAAVSKEETLSSFASIAGSQPDSPLLY